jgi:hypothetical protein
VSTSDPVDHPPPGVVKARNVTGLCLDRHRRERIICRDRPHFDGTDRPEVPG